MESEKNQESKQMLFTPAGKDWTHDLWIRYLSAL